MYNDSAILHYHQSEDNSAWDNDDWIQDDAVLHFYPDERDEPLPRNPSPPPPYTPSAVLNVTSPSPQRRVGRGKGRKMMTPRSRRKKADIKLNNPSQLAEVDDAELKSRMLDAIRKDDELYHRILRYDVRFFHSYTSGAAQLIERTLQPIPLDDFVALAVALEFPTRGLRSKITKFLDDQVRRCPPEA